MINKFLKAKNWQLFVLCFGIPIIIHIALMVSMVLMILSSEGAQVPDFNYTLVMVINFAVFGCVLLGWFWSIAIGLQKYIPDNIKLKTKQFKGNL